MELLLLASRIERGHYEVDPLRVAEAMIEEIRAARTERGSSTSVGRNLSPRDLESLLEALGVRPRPQS